MHVELYNAVSGGQIVPYFQPLVNLRTRQIDGLEVLARWQHPLRGLIAPDEFIPLAEKSGLIGELTQSILRQTFMSTVALPAAIGIAVNISPLQLHDRQLATNIQIAADDYGFPLSRLTVEITESAIVQDLDRTRSLFRELHELGIRLSLDDFGTGYSSLQHLHSLPFDELKVDRSFVESMLTNRSTRKIAAAIVGLGQSLGLTTVAEGIHEADQAERLLWLGCDRGQGWLFGRPAPGAELSAMLEANASALPSSESQDTESVGHCGIEISTVQRFSQLEAIFDGAPVGLCFLDTRMRFLNINQRLAEMNGRPVADHLGRSVAELYPSWFPAVEGHLHRAINGESLRDVEVRRFLGGNPDEKSTLLVSYQPARDEAGEVTGVSIAVVDITERKRVEEALRESEDHFRHTVELSPHISWTRGADGAPHGLSRGWEELTGISLEECQGTGWLKALHPDDIPALLAHREHCLRTGDLMDSEYRVLSPDGWRWMRSRAAPRRNDAGNIIRWYGCLEDIHDRKTAELELSERASAQPAQRPRFRSDRISNSPAPAYRMLR